MGGSWGLSEGTFARGRFWSKKRTRSKCAAGKTVWLENAQTDKAFQYQSKAQAEGIKSVLVVPLMLEQRPSGF